MIINILGIAGASIALLLSICCLNRVKVNLKAPKTWLIFIFYLIIILLGVEINDYAIKPFYNYMAYLLIAYLILDSNFKKSFLTTNIIYFLLMLIDVILFTCASYIIILNFKTGLTLKMCIGIINNSPIYSFILNILCSMILLIITTNKKVIRIYNKLIDIVQGLKAKRIGFVIFSIIIVFFTTYVIICYSNNIFLTIIMFISIILIIIYISIKNFKVMNEYEETKKRYSSVEQSLIEYEDMIDKYRVNNHENKNHLLLIQNMIKSKDKNVNEYIDNLVGNVYMTNEKIMMDISKIPAGGLRATIHAKLNIMDDKKIKYVLDIDRKLRVLDIESMNSDVKMKVCNILSIFIDNAIDEVETHKKERLVNILMYVEDDKLVVEITNKFKNKFDPNKMFDKKYTTKKEGHGYGLSLAKELIDSEDTLSNYYKIEDDLFTQVLEIKVKR